VALGLPELGRDELVYNSAVIQHRNIVLARHRKIYLPTYGIFDEARYFARGRDGPSVSVLPSGWKVGILICEDFWHPGLLYLLAIQGVDLILVMAAAPGSGEPDAQPASGGAPSLFSSPSRWSLLARAAAFQYGVYLALANRAGVEEGLVFAGGSLLVDPSGEIVARGPQGGPGTLEAQLSRASLRQSRTPSSHLRDEDPGLMVRALQALPPTDGEAP
jgi:predicted amidohydrolase